MLARQGQIKAEVSDVNTVVKTELCLTFTFIYYFIPQH